MATLTISHYIYLNKEERYKLHNGISLEVIGVSVPVWFHKGTTSEPAKELFCKYKITNNDKNNLINITDEGYEINLPQKEAISEETKGMVKAGVIDTSEKLLDIEDGGSEELEFRQYSKIENNNVVHFCEIKSYELLKESLS